MGITIVAICIIIIYGLLTLTFIVGTIIHLVYLEWSEFFLDLLGSCVFTGLILMFLNI